VIDLDDYRRRNEERRKRRDAATPDEWWVLDGAGHESSVPDGSLHILIGDQEDRVCEIHIGDCEGYERANATFIAASRNDPAPEDIDALIAEVERLRKPVNIEQEGGK
jgi:hypothetical protein